MCIKGELCEWTAPRPGSRVAEVVGVAVMKARDIQFPLGRLPAVLWQAAAVVGTSQCESVSVCVCLLSVCACECVPVTVCECVPVRCGLRGRVQGHQALRASPPHVLGVDTLSLLHGWHGAGRDGCLSSCYEDAAVLW